MLKSFPVSNSYEYIKTPVSKIITQRKASLYEIMSKINQPLTCLSALSIPSIVKLSIIGHARFLNKEVFSKNSHQKKKKFTSNLVNLGKKGGKNEMRGHPTSNLWIKLRAYSFQPHLTTRYISTETI